MSLVMTRLFSIEMFPAGVREKVMALMTHEGSGLGNSERDLRKICKGAEIIKPMEIKFDSQGGPVLQTAENKINDWIAEAKRSL